MSKERLILFIDDKNVYNSARRAFFSNTNPPDPHYYGQVNPIELGKLICSKPAKTQRQLTQVRVYTGLPDSTKEPKTYAAHMQQCSNWQKLGAEVIKRSLRYPQDWPASKPQQKGVDVALAIDFVALALDGFYDVGVIASTDADLRPAIEYVIKKCANQCHVEVAAWFTSQVKNRLSVPGLNIWCHRLDNTDYNSVADLTDYSQSLVTN